MLGKNYPDNHGDGRTKERGDMDGERNESDQKQVGNLNAEVGYQNENKNRQKRNRLPRLLKNSEREGAS